MLSAGGFLKPRLFRGAPVFIVTIFKVVLNGSSLTNTRLWLNLPRGTSETRRPTFGIDNEWQFERSFLNGDGCDGGDVETPRDEIVPVMRVSSFAEGNIRVFALWYLDGSTISVAYWHDGAGRRGGKGRRSWCFVTSPWNEPALSLCLATIRCGSRELNDPSAPLTEKKFRYVIFFADRVRVAFMLSATTRRANAIRRFYYFFSILLHVRTYHFAYRHFNALRKKRTKSTLRNTSDFYFTATHLFERYVNYTWKFHLRTNMTPWKMLNKSVIDTKKTSERR